MFDCDHDKVEALDDAVAKRMGFPERYGVSGQTYTRKVDAQVLATLASVAASSGKTGNDWRLLAHLREVEEPWETEQIGSSAMPYKRNPMRAERICGMSRHVITLLQDPFHTAATQWLERSLDDSSNRRLSIPDAFLTLDGVLVLVENVARRLSVNPAVVGANLTEHLAFMATETFLMRAASKGGDRQALHERIRQHAFAAASEMKAGRPSDLLDRISNDDAFGMDRDELDSLVDPHRFIGRAPEQVDQFLDEWVRPLLDRFGADAAQRLEDPDVRV